MDEEQIDIVDKNDCVIGKATESEIYKHGHRHRVVHVLVFDSLGRMALQKRSLKKAYLLGGYSTAVGGRVSSGENYLTAAKREYKEELGILTPLKLLDKTHYSGMYKTGELKMILSIYITKFDGPFRINTDEVESLKFYTLNEIKQLMSSGAPFHPELKFILEKYYLNT